MLDELQHVRYLDSYGMNPGDGVIQFQYMSPMLQTAASPPPCGRSPCMTRVNLDILFFGSQSGFLLVRTRLWRGTTPDQGPAAPAKIPSATEHYAFHATKHWSAQVPPRAAFTMQRPEFRNSSRWDLYRTTSWILHSRIHDEEDAFTTANASPTHTFGSVSACPLGNRKGDAASCIAARVTYRHSPIRSHR